MAIYVSSGPRGVRADDSLTTTMGRSSKEADPGATPRRLGSRRPLLPAASRLGMDAEKREGIALAPNRAPEEALLHAAARPVPAWSRGVRACVRAFQLWEGEAEASLSRAVVATAAPLHPRRPPFWEHKNTRRFWPAAGSAPLQSLRRKGSDEAALLKGVSPSALCVRARLYLLSGAGQHRLAQSLVFDLFAWFVREELLPNE